MTCRACQASLHTVCDFGVLALSRFPERVDERLPMAPLDLCRCSACGLVQLRDTVPPDQLFRQYWYRSGTNETMRAELADVVADGLHHLGGLADNDLVVDVGANDGTLLAEYARQLPGVPLRRVAYEPAHNFREVLRPHCDAIYTYFPMRPKMVPPQNVRLLTSIACFYAVDNPTAFVREVADLLTPDGIWIVQFQDLHQMLRSTAFDDVCHEHLFYPSLASVERLLAPHDLVVVDAQQRAINGGSLRLVIGRRRRIPSLRVEVLRAQEADCEDWRTLGDFAARVQAARKQIRIMLQEFDGVVDLYGASTKGNTLLQICGIGPDLVRQAWERSPTKWGRHTVTGIPIVSEDVGRADPPDALLVGIWQFRDAVIQREAEYLRQGGQLIFPLPMIDRVTGRHKAARQGVAR